MLGIGLEPVGYSSAQAQVHAAVAASVSAAVSAWVTRTITLQDPIHVQALATVEAINVRITPAAVIPLQASAVSVVRGVIFKIGRVHAQGAVTVEVGVNINGFFPAPPWRRIVLDPRQFEVIVGQALRDVVVERPEDGMVV